MAAATPAVMQLHPPASNPQVIRAFELIGVEFVERQHQRFPGGRPRRGVHTRTISIPSPGAQYTRCDHPFKEPASRARMK